MKVSRIVSVQAWLRDHLGVFPLPTHKVSRMEFFSIIRKHFGMCGIQSSRKSPKGHSINIKNSTVIIVSSLYAALTAASLSEANGFDESTNIVFRSFSMFACIIVYGIIVWNSSKIFEFIESVDDTVRASKYWFRCKKSSYLIFFIVRLQGLNYSESQVMYINTSQKMIKWIEILDITLLKVTPILCIAPALIVNFVAYYAADSEEAAFELPIPMW